jgi:hypothetical protein
MVAEAFIGPRPLGHHIHHKDANKQNARADNLEYVTPKAHAALTPQRGERNPRVKLTEKDVRAIRGARCTRANIKQWAALAAQYGVSIHTIRSVRERSSWKHLP